MALRCLFVTSSSQLSFLVLNISSLPFPVVLFTALLSCGSGTLPTVFMWFLLPIQKSVLALNNIFWTIRVLFDVVDLSGDFPSVMVCFIYVAGVSTESYI